MVNVPLDMLVFFIYKMRLDILESSLDTRATYAGMNYDAFVSFLDQYFQKYKAAGEESLTVITATKEGVLGSLYGFESTILKEYLPILIEHSVATNEVIQVHNLDGFNKTGEVRSKLTV